MVVKKLKENSSYREMISDFKKLINKWSDYLGDKDQIYKVIDTCCKGMYESLKEGYSDWTVSTSEIMDAINALEELVEMMDDAGIDSIHASSNTYGLGQHFIGFPGGFINYHDVYSYVGGNEDEEYEEEEY